MSLQVFSKAYTATHFCPITQSDKLSAGKETGLFYDNVILLGDALHTSTLFNRSGTKLAMEDAIALAQSFTTTSECKKR